MINQAVDPQRFISRARQIKTRIPIILTQWGLLPKFKRWRLAQDPDTGMVVLFGVLNNKYIATHTTTPFSNYFDPRLLQDLETELHVKVISSANDGLRYAFVLENGQVEPEPAAVEEAPIRQPINPTPANAAGTGFIERRTAPRLPNTFIRADDLTLLRQRLDSFLKITEAMAAPGTGSKPDVLLKSEAEFNQKMIEYESNRNNSNIPISGAAG